jgi:hypothetical protein
MFLTKLLISIEENYTMGLMQEIQKMDPTEIAGRPEVKALWNKSLFWSFSHRRSARNPLGIEVVRDGFFDYKKVKQPVPLSAAELALLCWTAAGTNGLIRGDGRVSNQAHDVGWEGTVNTSAAYRWYYLFFNNDDGLFLYRRHVPTRVFEIETQPDMAIIFKAFKEGVTQLSDKNIIDDPSKCPAIIPGNDLYTFKPGTTQFFLVADTTVNFMTLIDHVNASELPEQKIAVIDDATGKPAGVQKWLDNGYLKGPRAPLSFIEDMLQGINHKETASCLQNLSLCSAAMGLGIFPHIANMQLMMGGSPFMRGLGFKWVSDKAGNPYPIGIDGICEGHLPPYMTIDEAVDDYFSIPFGPRGSFVPTTKEGDGVVYTGFSKQPRAIHRPYKNPDKWLQAAQQDAPTYERKQVLKDLCNYIYNKYGRFPKSLSPFICPYVIQVHHIDPEFYDEYWVKEAITEEQRVHLDAWHNEAR